MYNIHYTANNRRHIAANRRVKKKKKKNGTMVKKLHHVGRLYTRDAMEIVFVSHQRKKIKLN